MMKKPVEFGSLLSNDSQFQSLKQLTRLIILIRSRWFHRNTRILRSEIKFSTGIIVGDLVLTAAHNIFQQKYQVFCDQIDITFSLTNDGKIYKESPKIFMELNSSNFRCRTIRRDNKITYENDFAFIKLPMQKINKILPIYDLIGLSRRVYLLSNIQYASNQAMKAYIVGFPDLTMQEAASFKNKKQLENNQRSVDAYCRQDLVGIKRIQDSSVYYFCKTLSGQSGSPVLVSRKSGDQQEWYIIGVHNSYSKHKTTGKGMFINSHTADILREWHYELTNRKLYVKDFQEFTEPQKNQISILMPQFQKEPSYSQLQDAQIRQLKEYLEIEFADLSIELLAYYKAKEDVYTFDRYIDQLRATFNQLRERLIIEFYKKLNAQFEEQHQKAANQENIIQEIQKQAAQVVHDLMLKVDEQMQIEEIGSFQKKIEQDFIQLLAKVNDNQLYSPNILQEASSENQSSPSSSGSAQPRQILSIRSQPSNQLQQQDQFPSRQNLGLKENNHFSQKKLKHKWHELQKIPWIYKEGKSLNVIPIQTFQQQNQQPMSMRCTECGQDINSDWYICLNRDCVDNQTYLCSNCVKEHQDHLTIQAKPQTIKQVYHKANSIIYEDEELKVGVEERISVLVQLIGLNLLKKLLETFSPKIIKTLLFLSSILFKDQQTIQTIVEQILTYHNKDQIYKLSIIYSLIKTIKSSQIISILQSQIDHIQQLVGLAYGSIKQALQSFMAKVPDFQSLETELYTYRIIKKYESIRNIKTIDQFTVTPSNIYEIKREYYPYFKEIIIAKVNEQYQEKQAMAQKRNDRSQFWLDTHKKMQKIKSEILEILQQYDDQQQLREPSDYYLEQIRLDIKYFKQNQKNEIKSKTDIANQLLDLYILRKFSIFRQQEQYTWQSYPLKLVWLILTPTISNLVRLQIRYEPVRCCEYNCLYKFEAIKLFQIIQQNPNLEKIVIEGVRLYHFGRFVRNFWKLRCSQAHESHQHKPITQQANRLILRLNPSKLITLDLRILFKIRSKDAIYSLDYFMQVFPNISNLKVQFNYSDPIETLNDSNLINTLVKSLQRINRLKVWFLGQHLLSSLKFTQVVKYLSNITSVYLSDFLQPISSDPTNNEEKQINELNMQQKIFQDAFLWLFQHNEIEKLSIKRCAMMNMPFKLSFAKEVIVVVRNNIDIDPKYLQNPSIIEMFYLQNIRFKMHEQSQIFFSSLSQLQYMQMINSNITDKQLLLIPLKTYNTIKILNISQCSEVGDSFAEVVFKQLKEIVALDISKTNITPSKVLLIPSIDLQKLQISGIKGVFDELLRKIDLRWPMLKALNIFDCQGTITKNSINEHTFKNLTELQISVKILDEMTKYKLLVRGVEILPFC